MNLESENSFSYQSGWLGHDISLTTDVMGIIFGVFGANWGHYNFYILLAQYGKVCYAFDKGSWKKKNKIKS